MARRAAERPREDFGFFGPGSPTWRVWTHPTALIGFQRAVTIETLDPFLTAAVVDMGGVRTNPRRRFEQTVLYFLTVAVGDGRSAIEASDVLMRIHAGVTGIEPVSGRPYAANDPDSQLWIHLTAWHSILRCYEAFGPGRLAPADEDRYWAECAIAGELQTFDPALVPRTRDGIRAYFERERPRLALSDDGHDLFHYLLKPRLQRGAKALSISFRTFSFATVSTMPRWMRRVAGLRQPRVVDLAVRPVVRAAILAASPLPARLAALSQIAPAARPLLEQVMRGPEPLDPRTVTPAEARAAVDARRSAKRAARPAKA